jgi:hypothetical protein
MDRPVRPVALVILTLCALYPGLTTLWQGLHPIITGAPFNLMADVGPILGLSTQLGLPVIVPHLLKTGIGAALLLGVLGLWAGDMRAYPLALLGAAGCLLLPVGPMVMGAVALICLLGFRERAEEVPA